MLHTITRRAATLARGAIALASLAAVTLSTGQPAAATGGDTLYAVTSGNRLITFSSGDTCKINWSSAITGLQPREQVLGIDFRPANNKLYALGSSNRLYTIDTQTAQAMPVGSQPFTATLSGSAFGFDFNPAVDRIRVVSNSGQNLRLHPDTGALVAADKKLNYINAANVQTQIVGAAYTNPDTDPNTPTALYDLDSGFDLVALQSPPNDGVLSIVGVTNVNATGLSGFDISRANKGYAAVLRDAVGLDADLDLDAKTGGDIGNVSAPACGTSRLIGVDIATGKAMDLGAIGTISPIRALAVQLQ
jgi:hypothetical protein